MKDIFGRFFDEKVVLITGHTGFMGSWLALWLHELGAKIIGYALHPYTQNDNFVVTHLEEKVESIIGDIRDYNKVFEIFQKYKPEIVLHLAAQPIVRKSYKIPKETFDTNIGGTVNVFEAFRKTEESHVLINVTTDKVYENREWIWGYRENDRLGGFDPYSSSKTCSDLITSTYQQSYFNSPATNKIVSSVRSGNVIGGGDWQEERLIPDIMRAIKKNEEVCVRYPQSVRPWQYVLEPIRGYLILAKKMWGGDQSYSGSWNFGPDNNVVYSVQDIVDKIFNYIGKGRCRILKPEETDNFHETIILLLDNSKSFRYLGWKPALSIKNTIELVCEWYGKENIDYDFDVKQIEYYLSKITN